MPIHESGGVIPSIEVLNKCIPMFETLKDPTRQAILIHLLQHGPQTIGEIVETSPLSRPTVSHHVKVLEQIGFVEVTKIATRRICRVRTDEALGLLKGLVAALEADIEAARQCRDGDADPA